MATAQAALFQESTEELISGSEAIGIACALADVDVITAYPIRPYDTVMQYVARLKADGAFDFDFIIAESEDRKSTRLNSSHALISYAVFCLKKKKRKKKRNYLSKKIS